VARFPAAEAVVAAGLDPDAVRAVMPHVNPALIEVREASPRFTRFWFKGIVGMAFPRVVYLRPDSFAEDRSAQGSLIIHELMHVEQWRRSGPVRFLGRYLGDYVRGRLRGASHESAYRAIRAEEEARAVTRHLLEDG
jgi:hypothetical protein